jgi:Small metal-binding protein
MKLQPEDSLMSRRLIVAMLGFGLALFLMPKVTLAQGMAQGDHISQAITHTKQAIDEGKMGKAKELTMHAEAALTHAEAGEKAKANPHTEEGIKHLKQAIEEGKKGNAAAGTTHAEAALTHLEQAK